MSEPKPYEKLPVSALGKQAKNILRSCCQEEETAKQAETAFRNRTGMSLRPADAEAFFNEVKS